MTLDEHIYSCSRTEHGLELKRLLEELKLHRETEIRPCTKWSNARVSDQLDAIGREYTEVFNAAIDLANNKQYDAKDYDPQKRVNRYRANLAEKLIDLQTACETMLQILGFDDQSRAEG